MFLISFCASAQEGNILRVRKVQYDTSFYTTKTWDSSFVETRFVDSILPQFSERKNGYWYNNVFFNNDSLYIFSSGINKRNKRLAKKRPEDFWKKINRKIKNNKLSVYQVKYAFLDVTNSYRIDTITNTHFQIRNRETGQITLDESVIINSDTGTFSYFYKTYEYVSEYDTITLVNLRQNQFFCASSKNYKYCLFTSLVAQLERNYKTSRPFGHYKLGSKIDGNRYNLYLNFESQLCRKAILIQNSRDRYYVGFEIKKDSLFVLNSPAGEIHTGKIARKMNKIKFRDNRKNYTFYSRKQVGYSKRLWTSSLDEYYQYPIVK